jgi:hypothetical protein
MSSAWSASVGPQKRFSRPPNQLKSIRNIAHLVRKAVSEMQHSAEKCYGHKLMNVNVFREPAGDLRGKRFAPKPKLRSGCIAVPLTIRDFRSRGVNETGTSGQSMLYVDNRVTAGLKAPASV